MIMMEGGSLLKKGLDCIEISGVRFSAKTYTKKSVIFRAAEEFKKLRVVKSGVLKISISDAAARLMNVDFQYPGEWVGLEGFFNGIHECEAVSIADSVIYEADCVEFGERFSESFELRAMILKMLSYRFERMQVMMTRMGGMCARSRVAAFFLDISKNNNHPFNHNGWIELPITREDLSQHLGLKVETLSRVLGDLRAAGVIDIDGRYRFRIEPGGTIALLAGC